MGVCWLTRWLPCKSPVNGLPIHELTAITGTYLSNPFLNILFFASYGLCTYFYFTTMLADPGYIPKSGSRQQQKATIDALVSSRQFTEPHFCVLCMIRRPLRSKHCKRCNRCVAKEDHHCPWVNNCVAANNHRHFVLYVLFMETGILLGVELVLAYLEVLPTPQAPEASVCNILAPALCEILNKDPFTIVLAAWMTLQLVWVTMLLVVQLVQIARATTTYESMRGHLHDAPVSASEAITSFVTTGSTTMEGGQVAGSTLEQKPQTETAWQQWKRLLGLDTAINLMIHGSRAEEVRAQQRGNPFTRGVWTNCSDFWCDGAPLFGRGENGIARLGGEQVNYTRMFEAPRRVRRRRRRSGGAVTGQMAGAISVRLLTCAASTF